MLFLINILLINKPFFVNAFHQIAQWKIKTDPLSYYCIHWHWSQSVVIINLVSSYKFMRFFDIFFTFFLSFFTFFLYQHNWNIRDYRFSILFNFFLKIAVDSIATGGVLLFLLFLGIEINGKKKRFFFYLMNDTLELFKRDKEYFYVFK